MDETAVFFDMVGNTTVDVTGIKSVPLKSTGHEKSHLTVILAAKGDGTKLKPYIVFEVSVREVKTLQNVQGCIIATSKNGWMNDDLTCDWQDKVPGKLSFRKRLLVWDAYRYHISQKTKEQLKHFNCKTAVIPGGCTKYIQAPDVSWNKPFKAFLVQRYEDWISDDEQEKEYTKGGNMKAPSKLLMIGWVKAAWESLSQDLIIKSFRSCALTIALDGSEDQEIHCLKEGQPCRGGWQLLQNFRDQQFMANEELEQIFEEQFRI